MGAGEHTSPNPSCLRVRPVVVDLWSGTQGTPISFFAPPWGGSFLGGVGGGVFSGGLIYEAESKPFSRLAEAVA